MTAITVVANINKTMKLANSVSTISIASISKSRSSTKQSVWKFHDNLIMNNMQSNNDSSEFHLELRQYLNQPVIPQKANPVQYWQSLKNTFPRLYVVKCHCHFSTIGTFVFKGWSIKDRTDY